MKVTTTKTHFPFVVYKEVIENMNHYNLVLNGKKLFVIHECLGRYVTTEKGMGGVFYEETNRPYSNDLNELLIELDNRMKFFLLNYQNKKMISAS